MQLTPHLVDGSGYFVEAVRDHVLAALLAARNGQPREAERLLAGAEKAAPPRALPPEGDVRPNPPVEGSTDRLTRTIAEGHTNITATEQDRILAHNPLHPSTTAGPPGERRVARDAITADELRSKPTQEAAATRAEGRQPPDALPGTPTSTAASHTPVRPGSGGRSPTTSPAEQAQAGRPPAGRDLAGCQRGSARTGPDEGTSHGDRSPWRRRASHRRRPGHGIAPDASLRVCPSCVICYGPVGVDRCRHHARHLTHAAAQRARSRCPRGTPLRRQGCPHPDHRPQRRPHAARESLISWRQVTDWIRPAPRPSGNAFSNKLSVSVPGTRPSPTASLSPAISTSTALPSKTLTPLPPRSSPPLSTRPSKPAQPTGPLADPDNAAPRSPRCPEQAHSSPTQSQALTTRKQKQL